MCGSSIGRRLFWLWLAAMQFQALPASRMNMKKVLLQAANSDSANDIVEKQQATSSAATTEVLRDETATWSSLGVHVHEVGNVQGHVALGSKIVIRLKPDEDNGTSCEAPLRKIKAFIAYDEKLGRATNEEELVKTEIEANIAYPALLNKLEAVVSHIDLAEAMNIGEVFTANDDNLLVRCETGVSSVRLEEHTETASHDPIFQGDMAFPAGTSLLEVEALAQGKLSAGPLWPDCHIHYCIKPGTSPEAISAFTLALEKTKEEVSPFDYTEIKWKGNRCSRKLAVILKSDEEGCWSYVGMQKKFSQELNLGQGCDTVAIAMHELGHALGMHHEQARNDRDSYVRILWQNIETEEQDNFEKESEAWTRDNYDYLSLMHYDPYAFSINGEKTIQIQNETGHFNDKPQGWISYLINFGHVESPHSHIGQRQGWSPSDIAQLVEMYQPPPRKRKRGREQEEEGEKKRRH